MKKFTIDIDEATYETLQRIALDDERSFEATLRRMVRREYRRRKAIRHGIPFDSHFYVALELDLEQVFSRDESYQHPTLPDQTGRIRNESGAI